MAYVITANRLGQSLIGASNLDTAAQVPIGTIVTAVDPTFGGGEFIYLVGVASTVVGSLVLFSPDDFTTTLATANDKGSLAVAMAGTLAANFGWYQIRGKASVRALVAFADDADCYLTSTAGSMDDAVVFGDMIFGMKGAGAVANDVADAEIDLPHVSDGVTASGATLQEIDNVADVSARVQELTVTGNVTAGVMGVELNHTGTIIAATIVSAANHQGLFIVKDTSATGTIAHTLTLTSGTFNGSDTIATLNARDECLVIWFDSAGRGTIVENIGAVGLS